MSYKPGICVVLVVVAGMAVAFAPIPAPPGFPGAAINAQQGDANHPYAQLGELIDVNGDGLPDTIFQWAPVGTPAYSYLFLNNGSGWVSAAEFTGIDDAMYRYYTIVHGDVKKALKVLPTIAHDAFQTLVHRTFGIPDDARAHLVDEQGHVVPFSPASVPSGVLTLAVAGSAEGRVASSVPLFSQVIVTSRQFFDPGYAPGSSGLLWWVDVSGDGVADFCTYCDSAASISMCCAITDPTAAAASALLREPSARSSRALSALHPSQYTIDDVYTWATEVVGILPQEARRMVGQHVDGSLLPRLTVPDMRSFGMSWGAATKIADAASALLNSAK